MISGRGFKIGMHTHLSKFYYYYIYISIPSDLESPIESEPGFGPSCACKLTYACKIIILLYNVIVRL